MAERKRTPRVLALTPETTSLPPGIGKQGNCVAAMETRK